MGIITEAHAQEHARVALVNAVTPLRPDHIDSSHTQPALGECAARAVRRYLSDLGDSQAAGLYRLVLSEIELPLFTEVMRHCGGNQTRAAQILGITRATLRKKLAEARP